MGMKTDRHILVLVIVHCAPLWTIGELGKYVIVMSNGVFSKEKRQRSRYGSKNDPIILFFAKH